VAGYTAEPGHLIPEARGLGTLPPASLRRPVTGMMR